MHRHALLVALLASGLALPACFSSRRSADVDRTPTVDTGVGAAILMPGQSAPSFSRPGAAPGGTSTTRVGPEGSSGSSSASGSGLPSTGTLTAIGSSGLQENRHEVGKEEPLVIKWLTAPLGLLAAPFAWGVEQARGEPDPGPAVPNTGPPAAPPAPPATDFETQRLQEMERELAQRSAAPAPGTAATGSPGVKPVSIADELAALQRAPRREPPAPPSPPQARASATVEPRPEADGIVDRDGDGRIDEWIYREQGRVVRRALDRDSDGRVDTTFYYRPESQEIARVEEDENRDGTPDAWTEYRAGEVARRRADADGDGQVDTWSFYAGGRMTRHEQDTTGDGFRDRVGYYEGGHLSREEYDRDGDGRADIITHYDAAERVIRREEDVDRDGVVDVISHYEDGRLARKELLGAGTKAVR